MKQVFLVSKKDPKVNTASWLIQVYEMTDLSAQQSAVTLLSSTPGLTVDARTCDRGSYVTLECTDAIHALAVHELVMMADSHAELVYLSACPTGAEAVRHRTRPGTAPLPDRRVLDG